MSATHILRAPSAARPFGIFNRIAATFQHWADVRETRNELNRLTDRELNDIGLARGDIERVARGF